MSAHAFRALRNVRLLYVFGIARDFTPMLAIWVVYLTDYRDLSLAQVGFMEGLFWAVKLALEIPSGAFADHFGRRTTFLTALALEATGTLIFAFAGGFAVLALSYVIWSAGLAARSGNEEAYLYDALAAGERQNEYSDRLGVYMALSTIALLAGGLVGGLLAEVAGLQVAVLAALVPFALALPLALAMQEPPRQARHRDVTLVATVRSGLRTVWRSDELRSITLLQVSLAGVWPAFVLLGQPFLAAHDVPLALFGALVIPVQLARIGGGLGSGRITRRFGLQATLTAAVIGAASGLAIVALVDHVIAFAGVALAMASMAMALPAIGAYVNERTESHVRATVLSIAPMGTGVIMGVMSMAAGAIAARSLQLSFAAMSVAILLFAGANLLAWVAVQGTLPRSAEPIEV